jgi:NTP pyrophosphatase (non-canonical NTP hydrolase)
MELNDYQQLANRTDQRPGTDEQALAFPLLGLASEVGSLVNQYKKRIRDGQAHELFDRRAATELGDILWYVANLSHKLGHSLDAVAQDNLRRINERWAGDDSDAPPLLLDDEFPEHEQLPRSFQVRFEEIQLPDGSVRVVLDSNGQQLGDSLTDMSWIDDDYRYHDAFHLTYAAMLGWSPITRAFFKKQRDSDPRFREVEDSGRAKVIEEAIAALLFDYASDEQFLDGIDAIDFSMLELVTGMASRFEVRVRTTRDWERAILRSFEIWRGLRAARGGTVHVDLRRRSIELKPMTLS